MTFRHKLQNVTMEMINLMSRKSCQVFVISLFSNSFYIAHHYTIALQQTLNLKIVRRNMQRKKLQNMTKSKANIMLHRVN